MCAGCKTGEVELVEESSELSMIPLALLAVC